MPNTVTPVGQRSILPREGPSATARIDAAMRQFVDRALRTEDSLFTPGVEIWTPPVLDDLHRRFTESPDTSGDGFEQKFQRQLTGASARTIQLAAECLYVYFLVPIRTRHETKLNGVRTVLSWAPESVTMPDELAQALAGGFSSGGTGFNTYKPFLLQYLLEFSRRLKRLTAAERDTVLDDPWRLREFAHDVPVGPGGGIMREALLHLVHPRVFESVTAVSVKKPIVEAFSERAASDGANLDRRLFEIRKSLEDEYGRRIDFYEAPIIDQWQPAASRWGQFVAWARRFVAREDYEDSERTYKLRIAENLRAAREAFLADEPSWSGLLRKAFGSPNNITHYITNSRFLDWEDREAQAAALRAIWNPSASLEERIRGFCKDLDGAGITGGGTRLMLASFLNLANDVTREPPYRATPFQQGYQLTGYPPPERGLDEAGVYLHALDFLDAFGKEAAKRGLDLEDRLDAQSALWCVTRWDPEDWTDEERTALQEYRRGMVVPDENGNRPEPPPGSGSPGTLEQLAAELFLPEQFLQRIRSLLIEKRQVIFQGPPGTGKTYVALALARQLAGEPSAVEMVQFHPSYAYEDFVEGFRPAKDGHSGFVPRNGPLRRIAVAAQRRPEIQHVLVIDEINRGNLSKVFGELYFLLEYRDQDINLQYSDEKFSLPANLWIIGTMNTADRSIALVDSALRRRFAFVGFRPDRPPVDGLLGRWLEAWCPEMLWVADLLDRANARLDRSEFAIGPSYFMRKDLDEDGVRRIWEHSVIPYLEDQFFDQPDRLAEFALDRLMETRAHPGQRTSETESLAGSDDDAGAEEDVGDPL